MSGETLVVRTIGRLTGEVAVAIPSILLRDSGDLLVVYMPNGTEFKKTWLEPLEEGKARDPDETSVLAVPRATVIMLVPTIMESVRHGPINRCTAAYRLSPIPSDR